MRMLTSAMRWKETRPSYKLLFIALNFVFIVLLLLTCYGHLTLHRDFQHPRNRFQHIITKNKHKEVDGRTIFFLETSGSSTLRAPFACSVESASRHNPGMDIWLQMTSDSIDTNTPVMECVSSVSNITTLSLPDVFANSPLESWYKTGVINTSRYKVAHTSDIVRLILLWKHGGIYMDLDYVVMKPLSYFSNTTGIEEEDNTPLNALLILDRRHPFLEAMLTEINVNYSATEYQANGPSLMARLFKNECGEYVLGDLPTLCYGVAIYPPIIFAPFSSETSVQYNVVEKPDEKLMEVLKTDTFSVHWVNHALKQHKFIKGSGFLFDRLAKEHCPCVYAAVGKEGSHFE